MRKLLVSLMMIGLGLSLQGCGAQQSPQDSCNFVENSDQQRVSWGSRVPVILYIDGSVPTQYYGAIQNAADTWNKALGRELIKIGGLTASNGPAQDGTNIIYFLDTWESDRSNEQARTTVYWSSNRIYEADIRVNQKDFDFFWGDDPVANRVDVQSLVLHEMGHLLGLAHDTTPKSVMAASLPSAYLRRDLSTVNVSSISCEY